MQKKHQGKIHLLLTDIVMTGMNGFELAKHATELMPGIKLLFMSGYTNSTDTQQLLRVADHLIEKPISVSALAVKLREILEK